MFQPLFVDTSAIYAAHVPSDAHHAEANRILSGALAAHRTLVCSTDVFAEAVALLSHRVGTEATVRIGEDLRREDLLQLVRVDDEIRDRAWALFKERRLPRLSFTDCTSSAIMTQRRIREVFTFDADFRRLGHRTLPAPLPPPPRLRRASPLLKPRPPAGPRRGRGGTQPENDARLRMPPRRP